MRPAHPILVLLAASAIAGCSSAANSAGNGPAATPRPSARAAPHGAPARSPSPTPSPSPSPTPTPVVLFSASPSPAPRKVVHVPVVDAGPRIYAIVVNVPAAGNGDVVSGSVRTSPNVAAVHVEIAGMIGVDLPKVGAGAFAMSTRLANIPFFVKGTYPVTVTARDAKGHTAERNVSFTIR